MNKVFWACAVATVIFLTVMLPLTISGFVLWKDFFGYWATVSLMELLFFEIYHGNAKRRKSPESGR